MTAFYNEIDGYAAQWTRNLIAAGHVADGVVDERSIKELTATDLVGRTQCHFFSGIAVWSYALRLAGWPDDREVWTGSCPCQPFSAAGKRGGFDDERHLWPNWFALIRECRPSVVFGEQVAGPDGLKWFDAVHADLEGAGYSVGVADLCAAGVGAPHIRQRLFFVAYADSSSVGKPVHVQPRRPQREVPDAQRSGAAGELADPDRERRETGTGQHADGSTSSRGGRLGTVVVDGNDCWWAAPDWIQCSDGRARPVEPGAFPLAHGVAGRMAIRRTVQQADSEIQETHWYNRVGALAGIGNAIVPQVAAAFIRAAMEARP